MSMTRPPYPSGFREQMVELVRSGRSPEELAREFEPSAQSIRNWVGQADREVFPRQKPPHRRKPNQPCQKARRHLASQKTLPVLGEYRRVPHPLVDPETHESAGQKVELQLLHQLALRADRIESLQKKRPQQLLRRDPGTPRARIQSLEIPRHLRQRRVRQLPDRPQRMVLRNPRPQIDIAEQAAAALVRAPHDPLARSRSSRQRITPIPSAPGVFQQPASAKRFLLIPESHPAMRRR